MYSRLEKMTSEAHSLLILDTICRLQVRLVYLLQGDVLGAHADDRDVGGEWAYKMNVPTLPATYAISSVGLDDLIGPKDRFDTTMNLAGPESPDGMQYGILSTGDDPATGNGGILGNTMSRDSVVFTLSGLEQDFDLGEISNVWFHYGTSYASPLPPPPEMPEPATVMAFIMSAGALTRYARRRMKKERD